MFKLVIETKIISEMDLYMIICLNLDPVSDFWRDVTCFFVH